MSSSTTIYDQSTHHVHQVSYLDRVDASPKSVSLENVINTIRSNRLREHVEKIRQASSDSARKKLKLDTLPAFFPTLLLNSSNRLTEDAVTTGIIQFDVDLNKNEGVDVEAVKAMVCDIPECIYAFFSPSGGLKFGILTDFQKTESDTMEALTQRYRQAYKICLYYVSTFANVVYDDSVGILKDDCFLSWDEEAYYNPICKVLVINADCVYKPPEKIFLNENVSKSFEEVAEVLSFIPQDFDYDQRLPVNFAVFNCIGQQGIALLEQHWTTDSRDKLKGDLRQQYEKGGYGSFGFLVNVAKEYGYKVETGKARKRLKAQSSDFKFESLYSVDEGTERLRSIPLNAIDNRKSAFINISAGLGKTRNALEILKSIPSHLPVLYLVKDHSLADEIVNRFKQLQRQTDGSFRDRVTQGSNIVHIKGKERMCEMPDVIKEYKDAGVLMPYEQCHDCPYQSDCRYINQFNEPLSNIRLMTHNELMNNESAWFYGSKDGMKVERKAPRIGKDGKLYKWRGWTPNFIIVDEDWLLKDEYEESLNTDCDSIRNVLNDAINGSILTDAIQNNKKAIIDDYRAIQADKPKTPKFVTRNQYIEECSKQGISKESVILRRMYDYVKSDDESCLQGLRLKRKKLMLSTINQIEERYRDVPTLFLDATANKSVVNAILPDVKFHSIKVRRNPKSNVFQMENFTITKKWLSENNGNKGERNRCVLVRGLSALISKYKNVGLITYKTIPNFNEDFDAWLAGQLGITLYGHFGALRGSNDFNSVDCLLVVGRHQIPENVIEDFTYAIYGRMDNNKVAYVNSSVRMANGDSMLVNNLVQTDNRAQVVNLHFSRSETTQAVERARLIREKPKDVYIFANESLGADIEVSSFFRFEDHFTETKYDETVSRLIKAGYCQNKQSELLKLGLSISSIKKDRKGIELEFTNTGIQKVVVSVKDVHRVKRDRNYYVNNNEDSLRSYLKSKGCSILSIVDS